MEKLLVICGPTSTGKTTLAAQLAKKIGGELVSADSRQVYRGMDLATGKDRPDVPIWLYDVVDPDEEFSVSGWVKLAKNAIRAIHKKQKLPIVVGGTGLYIHALLKPFETIDIPPNIALRERLSRLTVEELQKETDRGSMNDSDWNNPRRLIRRIEVSQSMVVPYQKKTQYDYLMVGLTAPMSVLDERIDTRLKNRNIAGLQEEISSLRARFDQKLPSMSAIGLNEHAYARRQMTWFRKQKDISWFDITHPDYPDNVTTEVFAWYTGGNP